MMANEEKKTSFEDLVDEHFAIYKKSGIYVEADFALFSKYKKLQFDFSDAANKLFATGMANILEKKLKENVGSTHVDIISGGQTANEISKLIRLMAACAFEVIANSVYVPSTGEERNAASEQMLRDLCLSMMMDSVNGIYRIVQDKPDALSQSVIKKPEELDENFDFRKMI